MVTKKQTGIRLHAVMVRYTPALWALSVWIPMVSYFSFLQIVDPATWFASFGFMLAGLVFVYDGLVILPEKGKIAGIAASIVIMILGAVNIFFASMIWFNMFNPFVGNSTLTPVATITLGFGVVALFVSGTIELISNRSYSKTVKSKLGK